MKSKRRKTPRQLLRIILLAVWRIYRSYGLIRLVSVGIVIWLFAGTGMSLVERGTPGYETWAEAMWSVLLGFFAASPSSPETTAGRFLGFVVIVSGVAFAGLFTAGVASILVQRSLRRRHVSSFKMEDHLVLCNWSPRALEWIREVHSPIVLRKRPVVIVHDEPNDIDLPDAEEDPAFKDVYIVKGDPVNEVVLRRASIGKAYSVVVLADERQAEHADGKTILICVAVRYLCRGEDEPNLVAECRDVRFRKHLRKAGADEVITPNELGVRLLARASLFHGMTQVYQELLTVGRNANEIYLVPVPAELVGMNFTETASRFLRYRQDKKACLLVGIYRGEKMMLNPTSDEAGPIREGDELILMSETPPHPDRPLAMDPPIIPPDEHPNQSTP